MRHVMRKPLMRWWRVCGELLQSWETVGSGVFVLHCIVLGEVLNMCET